jgi:SNF2 family DNA or RNA helicase
MYLDTANSRVFLKVRNPALLYKVLPGLVEDVNWRGHNLAVDHNVDTTKILRNLNIRVPSPIRHEYHWPGRYKPFEHQITTAEFLTLTRKGFVLNEMGTAKTASVLWAADYLMDIDEVQRVVVVAPLSTLERVWREEIFSFIMHRSAVVLHGTAEKRLSLFQKQVDFYIVNYEGLDIIGNKLRRRKDIDLVIVDEAAFYRNGSTGRYKTLVNSLPEQARLWLLTGTPCPNSPEDAWALARLVNKAKVPEYQSTWKRKTMQQVTTHRWRAREGSDRMVFDVLQPAVRFAKKDCLDLPPVTFESRSVEMTAEQRKAYALMRMHMVTFAKEHQITAVNAADKVTKLRQILLGSVKDPETGAYVTLDHSSRLKVLLECIEQASAKVIVVVPFKGITYELEKEISKQYSCEVINGDVSTTKRNRIFREFKETADPHVLLCHPKVMAHGLNLTEADMTIFYGPIYSNDQSQQVMERFNRPGQKRNMTVIRIGANALEWEIYAKVESNRVSQETILDLYKLALQT